MDTKNVEEMIAALLAEEQYLSDVMKKADIRLARVRHARMALVALESEEPPEFEGKLADAIRAVLKNNPQRSMSPVEVRDSLTAIGYETSKHKNPLASIHSVLKRLVESGDANSKEAKDGSGTRYWWIRKADTSSSTGLSIGNVRFVNVAAEALKIDERFKDLIDPLAGQGKRMEEIARQIKEQTEFPALKALEELKRRK